MMHAFITRILRRFGFTGDAHRDLPQALLLGCGLAMLARLVVLWWPLGILLLAGAAAGCLLVRRQRVIAQRRAQEAAVQQLIGAALTDAALQWAVTTWARRSRS